MSLFNQYYYDYWLVSHDDSAMDRLFKSSVEIRFNGFSTSFFKLNNHGWDIKYHQDFLKYDTIFIFTKENSKIVLSIDHLKLIDCIKSLDKGIDFSLISFEQTTNSSQYKIKSDQDFIKCQEALLEYQTKKLKKMTENVVTKENLQDEVAYG